MIPTPQNMSSDHLGVGIDFGGTSVKIGVVDRDRVIDQAPPLATQEFDGAPPLIDAIAETQKAYADSGEHRSRKIRQRIRHARLRPLGAERSRTGQACGLRW